MARKKSSHFDPATCDLDSMREIHENLAALFSRRRYWDVAAGRELLSYLKSPQWHELGISGVLVLGYIFFWVGVTAIKEKNTLLYAWFTEKRAIKALGMSERTFRNQLHKLYK